MQNIPIRFPLLVLAHIGKTVGVPLNPSAMIMRSLTIKAPIWLRTQCDNCAHSAAMRMYAWS